jgi:hypothetical protein
MSIGRAIEAMLEEKCPKCGANLVDLMGMDCCPNCDLDEDDRHALFVPQAAVRWNPRFEQVTVETRSADGLYCGGRIYTLGGFLTELGITLDDCRKALTADAAATPHR